MCTSQQFATKLLPCKGVWILHIFLSDPRMTDMRLADVVAILANATSVCLCVLSHTKSVVCYFVCLGTRQPIFAKFCIVCSGRIFSPLGSVPTSAPKSEIFGLNFGLLTANIWKTVIRSQLELNISSMGLKCIA